MAMTQWNDKEDGFSKSGFHPDLLDAMLYSFRFIYANVARKKEPEDEEANLNPLERMLAKSAKAKGLKYKEQDDWEEGYL